MKNFSLLRLETVFHPGGVTLKTRFSSLDHRTGDMAVIERKIPPSQLALSIWFHLQLSDIKKKVETQTYSIISIIICQKKKTNTVEVTPMVRPFTHHWGSLNGWIWDGNSGTPKPWSLSMPACRSFVSITYFNPFSNTNHLKAFLMMCYITSSLKWKLSS